MINVQMRMQRTLPGKVRRANRKQAVSEKGQESMSVYSPEGERVVRTFRAEKRTHAKA